MCLCGVDRVSVLEMYLDISMLNWLFKSWYISLEWARAAQCCTVRILALLSSSVGEYVILCLLYIYRNAFLCTPSSFLISCLVNGNQTTFAY